MNKEKDLIVLTSLVALGVIVASGLSVILQINVMTPVLIFGIIMFPLILLQTKKRFIYITENLEKMVFFVTLFTIAISFAILYNPI
ncbi:MAG: energy-converting hydrogenase A, subunit K [Methanobacteriaceae archaeon]|jgi:energy-converting hydrogenase A subunit K|nr:energy-converting hydrogenase A, subunit K [Candidatus Methanorudis spinitermitis]